VFFLISAAIAHSFVGYFMPVEVLVEAVTRSPASHPTAFAFVLIATLVMFVNFTWFREQVCIVICPYGRLQAALYDQDTILVGYDEKRGEPKGPATQQGAGDCVDCYRCVSVCPTGIDIRNGTQLECVGCANCIDACDEVMLKLDRAPGLVRYDSQRGFETGKTKFVRGRLFLYAALMLVGLTVFALALTQRRPFEALLRRSGSRPYVVEDTRVHNLFDLHVINKQPNTCKFVIEIVGPAGTDTIVATKEFELESLQNRHIPVHVYVPVREFRAGMRSELRVICTTEHAEEQLERLATAPSLGPSAR